MNLAYQQEGKRDLRLDWLRGYALFAMSINHAIPESLFHIITGGSAFLISAAEMFFFISGYTIGFISVGRDVRTAIRRMFKRTWIVYLATIGIAFGFGALSLSTGLILWGELEISTWGELASWSLAVVTLFDAFHGSDILVAYVIYLAIAPLAVYGLLKGHTWKVAGASLLIYVLSQLSLQATSLPFASFRHLASNNLLFFGAMVLGFHRDVLSHWWRSWRLSRIVDVLLVAVSIGLLWGYVTDFALFPDGLAAFLLSNDLGIREFMMPVGPLLIVLLYIRVFFIIITQLWQPLNRGLGWLMLPLGQASLFTFTMHLVAIPIIFSGASLFIDDAEEVGIFGATVLGFVYMAIIFGAVKLREMLRSTTYPSFEVGRAFMQRIPQVHAGLALAVFVAAAVVAAEPTWDGLEIALEGAWEYEEFEEDEFEDEEFQEDD